MQTASSVQVECDLGTIEGVCSQADPFELQCDRKRWPDLRLLKKAASYGKCYWNCTISI